MDYITPSSGVVLGIEHCQTVPVLQDALKEVLALPSFQVFKPYLQAMEEKPFLLPVMQKQKDK